MKVKDLIEELKKCNPDAEVYIIIGSHNSIVTNVEDFIGDQESYIIY